MKRTCLYILLLLLTVSSCDMFEAHPYDGKVSGETNVNLKNSELITDICKDKETIKFAFFTDTHRWYDDTYDCISSINNMNDVDFVVHGGDQTDFGTTDEFMRARDMMNDLNVPWVITIGNHDCLGTGKYVYKEIYKVADYAFTASTTRFIVLNTVALEYDYFNNIPNFTFIENELNNISPDIENTVFVMHVRPYEFMFNDNVAKLFQEQIRKFPNVLFCVCGHGHNIKIEDIFNDGIIYYECSSIQKRKYFLFTISKGKYEYEMVDF